MPGVEQACVSPAAHTEHCGWAHRDGAGDCELSKVGESDFSLLMFLPFILKYLQF